MKVRDTCSTVHTGGVDPLVDVLSVLEARSHVSSMLVVDADSWHLRFDAPRGWKFNAVLEGSCLLSSEGMAQPVRVRAGDCYLLTRPQAFDLGSDLGVASRPAEEIFANARDGVARYDGRHRDAAAVVETSPASDATKRFVALGGSFTFTGSAERLTNLLPPVLVLPSESPDAAATQQLIRMMDEELRAGAPGAALVSEHLAVATLVRMLRWHLAQDVHPPGWLRGLRDPVVAKALAALHEDPARAWTVASLASASQVSRSTFAQRFRNAVGTGPIEYLADWRMELAVARLQRGDQSIASIARSIGYGSESSFSNAFKRNVGTSPSRARGDRSSLRPRGRPTPAA